MRIQISQHRFHIAAAESFGRVGRRQPIARAWMAAGGHSGERDSIAVDERRCSTELHAAARANRSHGVSGLVALSLRFVANRVRRLIAAASSNFPFF
jgi:hypothetical protein